MYYINDNPFVKYLVFLNIYLSEGLHLAIATVLIPIYLLEKNFTPELTTFIAGLVMTPWVLKFIFGWIVDHYANEGRKYFALYGGLSSAITLIILAFIEPSTLLIPFIILLFLTHCGIGFLDVSSDALAIESTKIKERGKINGTMMAGLFTGMALGSSFFSILAKKIGYDGVFIIAGICILILLLPLILTKEKQRKNNNQQIGKLLIKEFKKRTIRYMIIFLPILSLNSGIITFAIPIFMKIKLILNISQIGLLTTIFIIGKIIGSLVGGLLADKWGRKKTIITMISMTIFFSTLLIVVDTWQLMITFYGILGVLNGGLFTSVLAVCMDLTNPRLGATQFSILISLLNTGELSGEIISGMLISHLGFNKVFLYSAWTLGPTLLILHFIEFKKPR
ncbi:MAG TPA: MFS transporter [Candidatus Atribacteria bacterium]|nr:MFS transporter [Candidatus Atribacteria bacterium]